MLSQRSARPCRATLPSARLICALVAALTVLIPAPVSAQTSEQPTGATVSVSPPTTELDTKPGETSTKKINLVNSSSAPRRFVVSVKNFQAADEEGAADLTTEEGPFSLKQWITVSPTSATIPANETQAFEVNITVPNNASPGGHFGAVVFTPDVSNDGGGGNVNIVPEVSSLILLRIPGNATETLSVASFTTQDVPAADARREAKDQDFFQGGPIAFAARLKNDGNVQIKPEGTVTIYNAFGSKIATLPIDSRNVLPGSIRKFSVTWDQKQVFGRYKAKLDVKYGVSGQTLQAETTVWAIPVGKVLIGLAIFLALFFLLWLPRKRLKKALRALAAGGE